MKRFIFSIATAALLLGNTSCLKSDDPTNEYHLQPTFITRAVDMQANDNASTMGTSPSTITLDATNRTIAMTLSAQLDAGTVIAIQTPTMNYSQHGDAGTTMVFSAGAITAGSHSITNFKGAYDFSGSIMVTGIVDNRYRLVCMTTPVYPYATFSTDNFSTSESSAAFALNVSTGKAILAISPFRLNELDEAVRELCYTELPWTATLQGYESTAGAATPVSAATGMEMEQYKADNITVGLQDYGASLTAMLDINGKTVNIAASMFYNGYLPF